MIQVANWRVKVYSVSFWSIFIVLSGNTKSKIFFSEQMCVKDQVPTTLELKEIICDICEHGRILERPSLEEIEICRPKTTRVCANVPIKSHWKKWCRNVALGSTENSVPAIKN